MRDPREALLRRVFDADYYLEANTDVRDAAIDPFVHYRQVGWTEGRWPTRFFDPRFYLDAYPDVAAAGLEPLGHYLEYGAREGRAPQGPSTQAIAAAKETIAELAPAAEPIERVPREALLRQLFDAEYYLNANADVRDAGIDPYVHYRQVGWTEGRWPNRFFDPRFYLDSYPDVAAAGLEPLGHYVENGASERRRPSDLFDPTWYLETYADVASSGMDPLAHYLAYGVQQGRPPRGSPNPLGPSPQAIAAAEETICDFASMELDLAGLQPGQLARLAVTGRRPDKGARVWEQLFLELGRWPRRVILASSLHDNPTAALLVRAAAELSAADELFVLATDEETAGLPDEMPREVRWRSLGEFDEPLDCIDRSALVTTFLHSVQPEAVMVVGSLAGWDSLHTRGLALGQMMQLFGVIGPAGPAEQKMARFFRSCFPHMTAIYVEDEAKLQALAKQFGVPPAALDKLRLLPPPASRSACGVGDVATTSEADRKGWGLYLKRLSAGDGFLAPPPDGAQ